jgi:hypothetical protein
MSIQPYLAVGLALGLLRCSPISSPRVTVKNTDAASLKVSPAGMATMAFTDLHVIRPDQLAYGFSNCQCVSTAVNSPTEFTFTFNGCPSARGGTMEGTVKVSASGTDAVVFTAVYDLTVLDQDGTWHYSGTQWTALHQPPQPATLTVPEDRPFKVAFEHATDATKSKTWSLTANMQVDLSELNGIRLWGSYAFQQTQPVGDTVTASIDKATPVTWAAGCIYPNSGVLNLSLPPAYAEIRINTSIADPSVRIGCGVITINGYPLTLGQ